MPVDWSRYPADWPAVRAAILEREGRRCAWCGVPDRAWRVYGRNGHVWTTTDALAAEVAATVDEERVTLVVLTIAHLGVARPDGSPGDKHDKLDVRPENLAALCQRCHLGFDLADHVRHAAETRRARRVAGGQLELVGVEYVPLPKGLKPPVCPDCGSSRAWVLLDGGGVNALCLTCGREGAHDGCCGSGKPCSVTLAANPGWPGAPVE